MRCSSSSTASTASSPRVSATAGRPTTIPGALLMKLRMEEPEEFAACAGAGVQGLVPDLADFWSRYLVAARDRGEIHPDTDIAEASEWVARAVLSLATVPGDTARPDRPRRGAHARAPLRHAGTARRPGV